MLTLVIGTFERLEGELARRLDAGRPAPGSVLLRPTAVVTPSRILNRHLQSALAGERRLALAQVHFHTFQGLARAILLDSGVPASAMSGEVALDEGVLDAVLRDGRSGEAFRGLLETPGLIAALRGSLADLEEAAVDSERLSVLMRQGGEGVADLDRLLPLLGAARGRRRELKLLNRSDIVTAATGMASDSALARGFAQVHFYGAYDLTMHLLEFVAALADVTDATFYFPAFLSERGGLHPAYRFAEFTRSFLVRKSAEPVRLAGPEGGPLGGRLAHVMGAGEAPHGPVPVRLALTEANSPEGELEAAADECVRLIRGEGWKPGELAVVARSLGETAPLAAGVFASRGLPWTSPARSPLGILPAGDALAALVDVLAGDFGPDTLLRACTTPWLEPGGNLPLRATMALAGRMWEGARAEDWEFLARATEYRDEREAAAALLGAVRRLARLAERFKPEDDWETYVRTLLATCEEALPSAMLDRSPAARDVLLAFERAVGGVRWAGRVAGNRTDARTFWRAARRAVREAGAAIYEREGGVALLDAMSARGLRPRGLFLVGMNDGVFPRSVREDPFLRDSARLFLAERAGYKIQLKGREGADEERLLFHLLIGAPRERLYISWSANDARGRPALPSGFLHDLAAALWPGSDPVAALEEGKRSAPPPAPRRHAATAAPLLAATVRHARRIDGPGAPGPDDGVMAHPSMPARPFSVTEIRDAVSCPFRVHVKKVLGVRPPHGPESPWLPEPSALGNLMHAVLERTVREARDRWSEVGEAELVDRMRAVLSEEMGARLPEYSRVPVFRDALEAEMADLLARFLRDDLAWTRAKGLRPDRFEERREGALESGAGRMPLNGKVDRIDRAAGILRVVDYKTHVGRGEFEEEPSFTPEFMQLGLYGYLYGATRESGLTLSVVHMGAGLGVVSQHAEGSVGVAFAAASLELARRVAGLLMKGAVSPVPDDIARTRGEWRPHCEYCEAAGICRRDHEPTRGRLEASPDWGALAEFIGAQKLPRDGTGGAEAAGRVGEECAKPGKPRLRPPHGGARDGRARSGRGKGKRG